MSTSSFPVYLISIPDSDLVIAILEFMRNRPLEILSINIVIQNLQLMFDRNLNARKDWIRQMSKVSWLDGVE